MYIPQDNTHSFYGDQQRSGQKAIFYPMPQVFAANSVPQNNFSTSNAPYNNAPASVSQFHVSNHHHASNIPMNKGGYNYPYKLNQNITSTPDHQMMYHDQYNIIQPMNSFFKNEFYTDHNEIHNNKFVNKFTPNSPSHINNQEFNQIEYMNQNKQRMNPFSKKYNQMHTNNSPIPHMYEHNSLAFSDNSNNGMNSYAMPFLQEFRPNFEPEIVKSNRKNTFPVMNPPVFKLKPEMNKKLEHITNFNNFQNIEANGLPSTFSTADSFMSIPDYSQDSEMDFPTNPQDNYSNSPQQPMIIDLTKNVSAFSRSFKQNNPSQTPNPTFIPHPTLTQTFEAKQASFTPPPTTVTKNTQKPPINTISSEQDSLTKNVMKNKQSSYSYTPVANPSLKPPIKSFKPEIFGRNNTSTIKPTNCRPSSISYSYQPEIQPTHKPEKPSKQPFIPTPSLHRKTPTELHTITTEVPLRKPAPIINNKTPVTQQHIHVASKQTPVKPQQTPVKPKQTPVTPQQTLIAPQHDIPLPPFTIGSFAKQEKKYVPNIESIKSPCPYSSQTSSKSHKDTINSAYSSHTSAKPQIDGTNSSSSYISQTLPKPQIDTPKSSTLHTSQTLPNPQIDTTNSSIPYTSQTIPKPQIDTTKSSTSYTSQTLPEQQIDTTKSSTLYTSQTLPKPQIDTTKTPQYIQSSSKSQTESTNYASHSLPKQQKDATKPSTAYASQNKAQTDKMKIPLSEPSQPVIKSSKQQIDSIKSPSPYASKTVSSTSNLQIDPIKSSSPYISQTSTSSSIEKSTPSPTAVPDNYQSKLKTVDIAPIVNEKIETVDSLQDSPEPTPKLEITSEENQGKQLIDTPSMINHVSFFSSEEDHIMDIDTDFLDLEEAKMSELYHPPTQSSFEQTEISIDTFEIHKSSDNNTPSIQRDNKAEDEDSKIENNKFKENLVEESNITQTTDTSDVHTLDKSNESIQNDKTENNENMIENKTSENILIEETLKSLESYLPHTSGDSETPAQKSFDEDNQETNFKVVSGKEFPSEEEKDSNYIPGQPSTGESSSQLSSSDQHNNIEHESADLSVCPNIPLQTPQKSPTPEEKSKDEENSDSPSELTSTSSTLGESTESSTVSEDKAALQNNTISENVQTTVVRTPKFSIIHNDPSIHFCKGFLEQHECQALIDYSTHKLETTNEIDHQTTDPQIINFTFEETPLIKSIESKVSSLTNQDIKYLEPLTLVKLDVGTKFTCPSDKGRVSTIVIHLTTIEPQDGGQVYFIYVRTLIKVTRGSAIFWKNQSTPLTPYLLKHGYQPLLDGTNWIVYCHFNEEIMRPQLVDV